MPLLPLLAAAAIGLNTGASASWMSAEASFSWAVAPAAGVMPTPAQDRALRAALDQAAGHGLPPGLFIPPQMDRLLASADPATERVGEQMLLAAAARYVQTVRTGLTPRSAFPPDWAQRPAAYDAAAELARALAENRVEAWLAEAPPPAPAYAQLQAALARYRGIAAGGGWPSVGSGPVLRSGAADDRTPALRQRLAAEDPAVAEAVGDARILDAQLAAALTRFQAAHGLTANGVLDRATQEELDVPVAFRIAQIRANLERWRWQPRSVEATRLEVNIAAQQLDVFDAGRKVLSMRTVVGRPSDKTPIFSDRVEAIVLNPPWNVPSSIAEKEILPKARRDPGYLARNHYVIQHGPGREDQRLQQLPGPDSALGLFKFDLPNAFNVYLHDTPAKAAFKADVRALSHGCVRLEQPKALALLLFGKQGTDEAAVDAALATGKTTRIALKRTVPVTIAYWTVFVDERGGVNFRPDLYGWDAELLRLWNEPID